MLVHACELQVFQPGRKNDNYYISRSHPPSHKMEIITLLKRVVNHPHATMNSLEGLLDSLAKRYETSFDTADCIIGI